MTICKISLLAMASKILLGKICSMKFWAEKLCVFSVTSEAEAKSTSDKLSPTPGSKMLTQNIPINSEIKEALKNQPKAFPPTRPTVLTSPSLAIPTTKVVNTKGEIIICTKRMNTVAKILILSLNSLAKAAS